MFPALKLRVTRLDPNTSYVIMVDIVLSTGAIVLNKLFIRLLTLLYSSLDALACEAVTKDAN